MKSQYKLSVTTQGPLYPPSEIMDENGDFVVIGKINRDVNGKILPIWGAAIVSKDTPVPEFGIIEAYDIKDNLDLNDLGSYKDIPLFTLPLPLPCNNYNIDFAPEQSPFANLVNRVSLPLNDAVPDYKPEHSRQYKDDITLGDWITAKGELEVIVCNDGHDAEFKFDFYDLIPNSLYTIMSLREKDLMPGEKTRPGPLGVPSAFITDSKGNADYSCIMNNPFPEKKGNRIINVVVLYMSSQSCHGGAIGIYGLGGDIHAHLKLEETSFLEFNTN